MNVTKVNKEKFLENCGSELRMENGVRHFLNGYVANNYCYLYVKKPVLSKGQETTLKVIDGVDKAFWSIVKPILKIIVLLGVLYVTVPVVFTIVVQLIIRHS